MNIGIIYVQYMDSLSQLIMKLTEQEFIFYGFYYQSSIQNQLRILLLNLNKPTQDEFTWDELLETNPSMIAYQELETPDEQRFRSLIANLSFDFIPDQKLSPNQQIRQYVSNFSFDSIKYYYLSSSLNQNPFTQSMLLHFGENLKYSEFTEPIFAKLDQPKILYEMMNRGEIESYKIKNYFNSNSYPSLVPPKRIKIKEISNQRKRFRESFNSIYKHFSTILENIRKSETPIIRLKPLLDSINQIIYATQLNYTYLSNSEEFSIPSIIVNSTDHKIRLNLNNDKIILTSKHSELSKLTKNQLIELNKILDVLINTDPRFDQIRRNIVHELAIRDIRT